MSEFPQRLIGHGAQAPLPGAALPDDACHVPDGAEAERASRPHRLRPFQRGPGRLQRGQFALDRRGSRQEGLVGGGGQGCLPVADGIRPLVAEAGDCEACTGGDDVRGVEN